jgi:hypothetical protein
MKKILYFIATFMAAICWYGCQKERNTYIDNNAPAPAQVSDIKVVATPGGAVITYKVPIDPNLLYTKAVYEIQPGIFREAKSSYYRDTLELVGFGDTSNHEVKIFSVGKNDKESEPLFVSVTPLTPPVQSAFGTLNLYAAFGGVSVSFQNNLQANLAIVVIADTTGLNTWAPVNTFYTKALKGSFSARGYDTTEMKFAVFLRDRWNNRSDTLKKMLKPLYEQLIPKNTIKGIALPTDALLLASGNNIDKLFDGITNSSGNIYATHQTNTLPEWFTFDFGNKVMISRFKEFQRANYSYNGAVPEIFEIWGSNAPNPNGSWDGWQLLGTFNSFKPSGLPFGKTSPDDINYAVVNGEDFEFKDVPPAVRFIRFKTLKTYGDIGQVVISELTFWGQIVP